MLAVPALRRGRCGGPLDGVLGLGCFAAEGSANPCLFGCVLPAAATLPGGAEGGRQGGQRGPGTGIGFGYGAVSRGHAGGRQLAACVPMWHSERQAPSQRSTTMHAQADGEERARAVCA